MRHKLILTFFLLNFFNLSMFAQRVGSSCPEDLFPKQDKQNRLFGYVNMIGEWVIPAQYIKAKPFVGNKAVVMKDSKYGIVNCTGYLIIDTKYDEIGASNGDKVWVMQNGLWGLINEKNQMLCRPQFNDIKRICSYCDYTWVKKDNMYYLFSEISARILSPTAFSSIMPLSDEVSIVLLGDSLGVINHSDGTYIIKPSISDINKLSTTRIAYRKNKKWGIFNNYGEQILEPIYDSLFTKYQGLIYEVRKSDKKVGLINASGKEITAIKYDFIGDFNGGVASFKLNQEVGYLSHKGKELIAAQYLNGENFIAGKAIVTNKENKMGLVDYLNKPVIPFEYDNLMYHKEGFYIGLQKGKYSFLSTKGTLMAAQIMDSVCLLDSSVYMRVKYDGKWGVFNPFLQTFLSNERYDKIESINHSYFVVTKNNLVGVLDAKGKEFIPLIHDKIEGEEIAGHYCFFNYKKKSVGLLNYQGKTWLEPEYEQITTVDNRFFKVKKNGKYGIIRHKGEEFIPISYDFISNSKESPFFPEFPVHFKKGKKQGLIDIRGKVIFENDGEISYIGENIYRYSQKGKFGLIKADGKPIADLNIEQTSIFSDKLCAIKQNNKWGFITIVGKIIIPCLYDDVEKFISNSAAIKLNNSWQLINKSGVVISKENFDSYIQNSNGRFLIKNGVFYKIMENGRLKLIE